MKVIGYRKQGMGILYLICLILGITLIILSILMGSGVIKGFSSQTSERPSQQIKTDFSPVLMSIFGIIISFAGGALSISYFSTPKHAIILYDNGTLKIDKNVVEISQIQNVISRRAHRRGISYHWGTIIIETNMRNYSARYIEECEEVASNLNKFSRFGGVSIADYQMVTGKIQIVEENLDSYVQEEYTAEQLADFAEQNIRIENPDDYD